MTANPPTKLSRAARQTLHLLVPDAALENPAAAPGEAKHCISHARRLHESLVRLPCPDSPASRCLLVGSRGTEVPYLSERLGWRDITCVIPPAARPSVVQHRSRPHPNAGRSYSYRLIEHDVEAAPLPLADGDFSLVIVWRDLERMRCDPEFALYELNRVTVPGGTLSLVADNAISLRATHALVCGDPAPLRIHDSSRESRWRLFTPDEIEDLARGTGWRIDTLTTIVPAAPAQWPWWKRWLFKRWVGGMRSGSGRPDPCWNNFILASATKVSGPTRSYPAWLYSDERIRQLKIEMIELVSRCAENSRPAA